MLKPLFLYALLLVCLCPVSAQTNLKQDLNQQPPFVLFYDDFSQHQLDTVKWDIHFNKDAEGVSVEQGNLIIRLLKIGNDYKVGGVTTRGQFAMKYGKVEVRAKFVKTLPSGELPAIWMMPVPGTCKYIESNPGGGEIDIMERVKSETFIHQTCHSAYATGEPKLNMERHGNNSCQVSIADSQDSYHIYGFENRPNELRFFVDGKQTMVYKKMENADSIYQWPYDVPFYLNINSAIGAEGKWPGPLTDDSLLPAEMAIDWVKITANEYTEQSNYY